MRRRRGHRRPRLQPLGADANEKLLAREHTTAREVILATLASIDVEACLRAGGLGDEELAAVRARLLAPQHPGPASVETAR